MNNLKQNMTETIIRISKGVAIVAASFSLIVCILLVANFLQTKTIDPLNSRALQGLTEKLQETPGDQALQNEIRALDLLARKAYFTNQWQLKTGAYLLIIGVGILLISLKTIFTLTKKLPLPEGCADADDSWKIILQSRKWLTGFGSFLLTFSLLLAGLSYLNMNNFSFIKPQKMEKIDFKTETWPGFRGIGGNSISFAESAPLSWNGETGENILWKVKPPLPGYNSPVIWKDKLFISGADKNRQEVYCYDVEKGEIIWQSEVKDVPGRSQNKVRLHDDTGYAPNTLATNGAYVAAIFPTGDLACFLVLTYLC